MKKKTYTDTQRLDFIRRMDPQLPKLSGGLYVVYCPAPDGAIRAHFRKSFRQAIDCLMDATKEGK